jgi:hypothetical protein
LDRYTHLHSVLWCDGKYKAMQDDFYQLLFVYLLSSPHGNMIGYYRLPPQYVATDMDRPIDLVCQGMGALQSEGFIAYDEPTNVLLIYNFLKWNPINSLNQAKGAVKVAAAIPKCPLLPGFVACATRHAPTWANLFQTLLEPTARGIETPSDAIGGTGTGTGTGTVNAEVAAATAAKFPPGTPQYDLSVLLHDMVLAVLPSQHVPAANPIALEKWCTEIDRLIRLDGHTPETVRATIEWALRDGFWRTNIRSAKTLREKFESLLLQSKDPRRRGAPTIGGGSQPKSGADKYHVIQ